MMLEAMEQAAAKMQQARGHDPERKHYGGKFARANAERDQWEALQRQAVKDLQEQGAPISNGGLTK